MAIFVVSKTQFHVDENGVPGQIFFVFWDAYGSMDSVTGWIRKRGTSIPADYLPAQVPYNTVTEAMISDWLADLEDMADIDAQIAVEIDKIAHPIDGAGLPWQQAYPLWTTDVDYLAGGVVIYMNGGYECIQGHTSQMSWAPPETPALWKVYVPEDQGPQPWVQPVGSHDAYRLDAQVTHNGNLWTSLHDSNVWEPPTQWQDEGPYP